MKKVLRMWQWSLLSLLLSFSAVAQEQQPTLEWVKQYDGAGSISDAAFAVAVDAEGNSYVLGMSHNENTYIERFVIVKYSPTGEEMWTKVNEEDGAYVASAIAVDQQGGVYVVGSKSIKSFFTIRYNAIVGSQAWLKHYEGFGDTFSYTRWAADVAVDNLGGVYITGYSEGREYGTSTIFTTIRYDAASGDETWVNQYDAGYGRYRSEKVADMAVDNNGGVYVAGTSYENYTLIRYDASTGTQSWVSFYGESLEENRATSVAVDNLWGVYITGTSGYHDLYHSSYNEDYITVRFDAATGKLIWASRFDIGNNGIDRAKAIAVDSEGGVFVTGYSSDAIGYSGYTTIRYEAATGEQSWMQQFNGGDNGWLAIAVDNQGGVYVAGCSVGDFHDIGYATLRYEAATGEQSWVSRYDSGPGGNYDAVTAIAVDQQGGIVVTGGSSKWLLSSDFATVRYVAATGEQLWVNRHDE